MAKMAVGEEADSPTILPGFGAEPANAVACSGESVLVTGAWRAICSDDDVNKVDQSFIAILPVTGFIWGSY